MVQQVTDQTAFISGLTRPLAEKLISELSLLPSGNSLFIGNAEHKLSTSLDQLLRKVAIENGFYVSVKRISHGFFISKKNRAVTPGKGQGRPPLTSEEVEADKAIYDRHSNGETLEQIGNSIGLTRERVRQKIKKFADIRKLPFGKLRSKATDEFMKPYIAAVKEYPVCIFCKKENKEKRNRSFGICYNCFQPLKIRFNAASRIRSFKRDGDRHMLTEASSLIKRFDLKPEDLY